jgi:urease accessory protein
MSRKVLWAVLGLVASAAPAFAHPGHLTASGFGGGIAHPLGGLDHVLAMVAVGLLASQVGGRALWALPTAFLSMMAVGFAVGFSGSSLPFVELGIALSAVAFGAAIALRRGLPLALAAGLVGVFAVFHGHAHGAEMPAEAAAVGYAAGFIGATALLHGVGLALGFGLARMAAPRVLQAAGGGVALAGLVLLARIV